MITLCIRYTLEARKRSDFELYARGLTKVVPRCGGELVGYWLPTKFAGPTNFALALILSGPRRVRTVPRAAVA